MRIVFFILALFILNSCSSVKYNTLYTQQDREKILQLQKMLISLGGNQDESKELATLAVIDSKRLANEYHLVSPPLYHNFLVNSGQRKRGLCFHFVEDLSKEINSRGFKSFSFKWGRANPDKLDEHNVIVVLKKGSSDFQNGIILDAWRNSGSLYFKRVKDDTKYSWREWKDGDKRVGFGY